MNVITPLNAYFALVVVFAQKYDKNAGVGTIVALMIPYVIAHLHHLDAALRRLVPAGAAVGLVSRHDVLQYEGLSRLPEIRVTMAPQPTKIDNAQPKP